MIACFEVGACPASIRVQMLRSLRGLSLDGGRPIARGRFAATERWSGLPKSTSRRPSGHVELGELCRVHRGQVTGANRVWIEGRHSVGLPTSVLFPSVTRARDLFTAGPALANVRDLRSVIDLPVDLDLLSSDERRRVQRF